MGISLVQLRMKLLEDVLNDGRKQRFNPIWWYAPFTFLRRSTAPKRILFTYFHEYIIFFYKKKSSIKVHSVNLGTSSPKFTNARMRNVQEKQSSSTMTVRIRYIMLFFRARHSLILIHMCVRCTSAYRSRLHIYGHIINGSINISTAQLSHRSICSPAYIIDIIIVHIVRNGTVLTSSTSLLSFLFPWSSSLFPPHLVIR